MNGNLTALFPKVRNLANVHDVGNVRKLKLISRANNRLLFRQSTSSLKHHDDEADHERFTPMFKQSSIPRSQQKASPVSRRDSSLANHAAITVKFAYKVIF